jgi:GT2 family glycosyltransferase
MRIAPQDVENSWDWIVNHLLPCVGIGGPPQGIQGPDPRAGDFPLFDSTKVWHTKYCLYLFTGNLLLSRKLFWDIGGFDEAMVGHGGEDCEFAMRAEEHQVPVIFAAEPIGYHVYHPRDQVRNEREVARNIEYMKTRHDFVALGIVKGQENELPLVAKKAH